MTVAAEFAHTVREIYDDLVTAVKGMMVTTRYLFHPNEIVTVQYGRKQYPGEPRHELDIPPTYRGELFNDVERCVVCELCAKACPTQCISMEFETGADKTRILHNFHIDMTICLFCGLCTEACPDKTKNEEGEKCLVMTNRYDFSTARKSEIGFHFVAGEKKLKAWREASRKRAEEKAAAKKAAAEAKKAAAARAAAEKKSDAGAKTTKPMTKGSESAPSKEGLS
ncbi:MAG: NADH-quinone oxidoreductase subunit I [Candidatus Hydrogenedentota bacterium]|nr:MAG: NADH-quinone oxidoreductase subunit I [Candidatus Hydrogenedentota bacterium]